MLRSVLVFAISAMFLGLGLGRFAFSPLMPELVEAHWMGVATSQSVAAANLVGYLVGALLAKPALRVVDERRVCIWSGALIFLSYALFLLPFGAAWFWIMRFVAGLGGALLMVVATAAAGRQLVLLDRGHLQPLVFVGLGLGALFAAVFLPPMLIHGPSISVAGLMIISGLALSALRWNGGFLANTVPAARSGGVGYVRMGWGALLVILAYGCDALGFVMHTVYLPDMLRRSYGYTGGQVGFVWAMFGIGACLAPVFVMLLRRVLSVSNALCVAFALKACGVALIMFATDPVTAGASLLVVGMLTPGIVILTSATLSSIAPSGRYLTLWAAGTALFALCQMASGMFIAATSSQGYGTALVLSVGALVLGAILVCVAGNIIKQGATS